MRSILFLYWNLTTKLCSPDLPEWDSPQFTLYFRITQAENNAEIRLGAKEWNLMLI